MLIMKELTEEQKKKIDEIKKQMFKELEKYDRRNQQIDGDTLDSGQGNPIISKYNKKIKEIMNSTQK